MVKEEVEKEKEEDKPIAKTNDAQAPPLPQDTTSPIANENEAYKDSSKNDSSKDQKPAERRQSDISQADTSQD